MRHGDFWVCEYAKLQKQEGTSRSKRVVTRREFRDYGYSVSLVLSHDSPYKRTCGRPYLSDLDLLGLLGEFTQYTEHLGNLLNGSILEPSV